MRKIFNRINHNVITLFLNIIALIFFNNQILITNTQWFLTFIEPCTNFLKRLANELELPVKVYHPSKPSIPIVVITWKGREPALPSILLNSHTDVVPVFEVRLIFL